MTYLLQEVGPLFVRGAEEVCDEITHVSVVLCKHCRLLRSLFFERVELWLHDEGLVVAVTLVIEIAKLGDDELGKSLIMR